MKTRSTKVKHTNIVQSLSLSGDSKITISTDDKISTLSNENILVVSCYNLLINLSVCGIEECL